MNKVRITIIITTILLVIDVSVLGIAYYYKDFSNESNKEINKEENKEKDNKELYYYIYRNNYDAILIENEEQSDYELIKKIACKNCEIRETYNVYFDLTFYIDYNDEITYKYVDNKSDFNEFIDISPTLSKKSIIDGKEYIFNVFNIYSEELTLTVSNNPGYEDEIIVYASYTYDTLKEGVVSINDKLGRVINIDNDNEVILEYNRIINDNKYMVKDYWKDNENQNDISKYGSFYMIDFDYHGTYIYRTIYYIENDIPYYITSSVLLDGVEDLLLNYVGKKITYKKETELYYDENIIEYDEEGNYFNYYIDKKTGIIYFMEDGKVYSFNNKTKNEYDIDGIYKAFSLKDNLLLYIDKNSVFKIFNFEDNSIIDTNIVYNVEDTFINFSNNNIYIKNDDIKNDAEWKKTASELIKKHKSDTCIISCVSDKCTNKDLYSGYLYEYNFTNKNYNKKAFVAYHGCFAD